MRTRSFPTFHSQWWPFARWLKWPEINLIWQTFIIRWWNPITVKEKCTYCQIKTIWPISSELRSGYFRFIRSFDRSKAPNFSIVRLAELEALAQICQFQYAFDQYFGKTFVNESIYKLIQDMAPKLNETVGHCTWKDKSVACEHLFRPIITDFGLCFTLNGINSREIYSNE